MAAHDVRELGRLVHVYGGQPIGSFRDRTATTSILHASRPQPLFYDCTHDNEVGEISFKNESFLKKLTFSSRSLSLIIICLIFFFPILMFFLSGPSFFFLCAAPFILQVPAVKFTLHHTPVGAALVSMVAGGCGSTRGVDELILDRVEVVRETRLFVFFL